jgi:hypothetical protein
MMTETQPDHDLVHAATGIAINPNPDQQTQWERLLIATWADSPVEWNVGMCKGCGRPLAQPEPEQVSADMAASPFARFLNLPVTICRDCDPIAQAHYHPTPDEGHERIAGSTPWWDSEDGCPEAFQVLIRNRSAPQAVKGQSGGVDWAKIDYVEEWNFAHSGKGLILTGDTGSGKTTALWTLARRIEKLDRKPLVISAIELSRRLSKAARDIERDVGLANARYLLIDDLGKEKMTQTVASTFYELLDTRLVHNRWMVFTTRFTGAMLQGRFGEPELGQDIHRRLRDACKHVPFSGGGVD